MMNFKLYFENESFDYRNRAEDASVSQQLEELHGIWKQATSFGDTTFYSMELYDVEIMPDQEMMDWLWGSEMELEAERKLLRRSIEKSKTVESEEYYAEKSRIDEGDFSEGKAFLSLFTDSTSIWYINSNERWKQANRYYLHRSDRIEEFMMNTGRCFTELYFHPDVPRSLRTLNYPFSDYLGEIIEQLSQINDKFRSVHNEFHDHGNEIVAQRFKALSQVECAPESNRGTAQRRTFHFLNHDGQQEAVCCELHTRLTRFVRNRDRMYFHIGKENIADGKVLIAHIGDHLD